MPPDITALTPRWGLKLGVFLRSLLRGGETWGRTPMSVGGAAGVGVHRTCSASAMADDTPRCALCGGGSGHTFGAISPLAGPGGFSERVPGCKPSIILPVQSQTALQIAPLFPSIQVSSQHQPRRQDVHS